MKKKNMVHKGIFRMVVLLFHLLLVTITVCYAQNPEIALQVGHSNFVSDFSYYGERLATVSYTQWDDLFKIEIKIWSILNGRLEREVFYQEKRSYVQPFLRVFFSKNRDEVILVLDEKKTVLRIFTFDLPSGKVIKITDIDYDVFLDKLEKLEIIRLKEKLKGNTTAIVYSAGETKKMVSQFGLAVILHTGLLENLLDVEGYTLSITSHRLKEGQNRHGDLNVYLIEKQDSYDLEVRRAIAQEPLLHRIHELKKFPSPIITSDFKYVVGIKGTGYDQKIICYDTTSNKTIIFANPVARQEWIMAGDFDEFLISFDYHDNTGCTIWNVKDASYVRSSKCSVILKEHSHYAKYAKRNENGEFIATQRKILSKSKKFAAEIQPPVVSIVNETEKKEIAKFILFKDYEWIVITPEGYYNASPNGDKYLNVRIGGNIYGIENYREQFYRPSLVKLALNGDSLKDYQSFSVVSQPPKTEIVDTPAYTEKDEVKVTIRLADMGGGIGDVRLYLNDTSIIHDSVRGITISSKPGEKIDFRTYTVKLLSGENVIKAVAFNADGTMQSNPAVHRVTSTFRTVRKPSMYVLAIGINEYKNPKLTLKYAVSDARLFADTMREVAAPLFETVNVKVLTAREETTKEHIKKTLEGFRSLNPDDVFVFYVASHGTVDEGEYFLITSNVGSLSTFRLREDALTQTELKEMIASIPSTKKMIVIDTCNAGKLGEALQVAMLTRGMSEETAIKILSRAVGSTILSASTSLQEALEGYQGHGLFTYVLAEGLKGKADLDRDGFIKTLEIANYVDSEVPALAEKIFRRAQYPTAMPSGQAFPVGKVK